MHECCGIVRRPSEEDVWGPDTGAETSEKESRRGEQGTFPQGLSLQGLSLREREDYD